MVKMIAVVSGKGGTGKSTVTASLAVELSKKRKILVADCDVDAPNLALAFGIKSLSNVREISTSEKAVVDPKICMGCGKCQEVCAFSAIKVNGKAEVNRFLCEGCGACMLACKPGAIRLEPVKNARIGTAETPYGFIMVSGELKMGESGSGKIVTEIRKIAENLAEKKKAEIILLDSAAGIGCPVIASLMGCDFALAVTEPTPAALSDLERLLELLKKLKIPGGLLINKYDLNLKLTEKIEKKARSCDLKLFGRIPYHPDFLKALLNLKPAVVWNPKLRKYFEGIANFLASV